MLDKKLYCIGHEGFSINEFITLLETQSIKILIDIRANHDINENKSFSQSVLREKLETVDIVYHWAGRHFGEKHHSTDNLIHTQLPTELAGFYEHMQGSEFPRAIMQLMNLVSKGKTILMCSEPREIMSHCDLIADYLVLQGFNVNNIHSENRVVEHLLSMSARRESIELIYDQEQKI